MSGVDSTLLDSLLSGAGLLLLAAVAWFFRQWSNGISAGLSALADKVDTNRRVLGDRLERNRTEAREGLEELRDRVDEGNQRTARVEGALGLRGWETSSVPDPPVPKARRVRTTDH